MQAYAKPRILCAGAGQTRVTTQTQSDGSQIIIFLKHKNKYTEKSLFNFPIKKS